MARSWLVCRAARVGRAALVVGAVASGVPSSATVLPRGFVEETVLTGLNFPTVVAFAPGGRVFVGEASGLIQVYESLRDPKPSVFADLRTQVHSFWHRGLLGLAVDPQFDSGRPYVYVLYTLDQRPDDRAWRIPAWGVPGASLDGCPTPPGAVEEGCAVKTRLARLEARGDRAVAETVLLTGWCQQFPSHSAGALAFGPDGALYASGGDGASFDEADYGQLGGSTTPVNVCGDPPGAVGQKPEATRSEGGALRAQSPGRTAGGAVLNGALLRLDPDTGAARPDNPHAAARDERLRRIVAYGLRNPFRFALRPGTSEVWIGDVGWRGWEEIDRVPAGAAEAVNFGWPCYEGPEPVAEYQALGNGACQRLQTDVTWAAPHFAYRHGQPVIPGEACQALSSAITGPAFYDDAGYPAIYRGALFFGDYNRGCIWALLPGEDGIPDPARLRGFATGTGPLVDLRTGPGGDLYYVDRAAGALKRIRYVGPAGGTAASRRLPAPFPAR